MAASAATFFVSRGRWRSKEHPIKTGAWRAIQPCDWSAESAATRDSRRLRQYFGPLLIAKLAVLSAGSFVLCIQCRLFYLIAFHRH